MSVKRWPFKDPDEISDFEIKWIKRLGVDTILTSTWTVPAGLTKMAESMDSQNTIVWLSGGTLGTTYDILNRITTAAGRTWDQTVKLKIKTK